MLYLEENILPYVILNDFSCSLVCDGNTPLFSK